jgi:FKBP-type peptidyl-prolyl cis-trans isomerase FkpA
MSVSTLAHPQRHGAALTKFWLAMLALVAAAIALAWFSTSSMRGETTATGVEIRTLTEGSGDLVKEMDGVLVEYQGRLKDGTVFDESGARGPQPMIPAQVIPGFREALLKMQQGGSYRVLIPSKLAYGAEPPPGAPIPPNADLEFDVKIVQLVPNAGLMMQQQQMMQGAPPPGQ